MQSRAAELRHREIDGRCDIALFGHVDVRHDHAHAQLIGQRLRPLKLQIGNHTPPSLGDHPADDSLTDTTGTPGDHCHLAVKH